MVWGIDGAESRSDPLRSARIPKYTPADATSDTVFVPVTEGDAETLTPNGRRVLFSWVRQDVATYLAASTTGSSSPELCRGKNSPWTGNGLPGCGSPGRYLGVSFAWNSAAFAGLSHAVYSATRRRMLVTVRGFAGPTAVVSTSPACSSSDSAFAYCPIAV